jgi:hypothetical protein
MNREEIQAALTAALDELATVEHERWAHWQRFLHGQGLPHGEDGSIVLPGELVRRWERQLSMRFSQLSEAEKESDRDQVRRYLPIIAEVVEKALRRDEGGTPDAPAPPAHSDAG